MAQRRFLRRSVSACPQAAEYKSYRGTLGFEGAFCDNQIQIARNSLILKWRDVRVVEGARLESVCRGNSTEGSNPSLSASSQATKYKGLISFTSLYREWA